MLVLDEAYCDTAPVPTAPPVDVSNPQVIRYRTFSKAYGLAGARIGYAIGERSVIEAFDKVRNHYGINRVGQLGALAALLDQEYLAHAVAEIAAARQRIAAIAVENGLSPLASAANFVAIHCGADGAFAARVLQALLMRDVFVRKPIASGLDPFIRVSCGRNDDLDVFAEALPAALVDARRDIMTSERSSDNLRNETAARRGIRERDDIHARASAALSLAAVIAASFGVGLSFGIGFPADGADVRSVAAAELDDRPRRSDTGDCGARRAPHSAAPRCAIGRGRGDCRRMLGGGGRLPCPLCVPITLGLDRHSAS